MANLYLDVDGVLLGKGDTFARHAHDFLTFGCNASYDLPRRVLGLRAAPTEYGLESKWVCARFRQTLETRDAVTA